MDVAALLERAAALAERGRGEVEPNPRVGALALSGDEVVGEGWHAFYGGPHAEEDALGDATRRGRTADGIVVTLEPCSSEGGTKQRPPCTRLLVAAGIRRVVVGCEDPDPRHRGRGLAALAASGIEVVGPHERPLLRRLLGRFERALALDRPWVHGKWAMTLDGKTATRTGSSRWISGEAALDWAHRLRARCDAVLVGIGTVLADDPELTVRRVPGRTPLRVVVDPGAALPAGARLLRTIGDGTVIVLVGPGAAEAEVAALAASGAEIERVAGRARPQGHGRLDPPAALRALGRRGVRRLLVEGGGGLLADLHAAGCLDQVTALVAPKLCGGQAARTPLAGAGIARMEEALSLAETYQDRIGDSWLLGGFLGATNA